MKLIISGSKTLDDYSLFQSKVEDYLFKHRHDEIELVITSGEPGAEALAERFAKENNIPLQVFTPDVESYGDEAKIISDTQMVEAATALMVFWDGVTAGKSRKQDEAHKSGIPVEVIQY